MYRHAGLRVGRAAEARPRRGLRRVGPAAAAVPAGHRVELLGRRPTCSAGSSRSSPGSRSTSSSPSAIFEPLGMTDTGFSVADADARRPARGALRAGPRDGRAPPRRPMGAAAPPARRRLSGGGGLVSHGGATTTASPRCCLGGGELDGVRLLGPRTVALHDPQPPARRRRPRGVRPPAVRRDDVRGRRLRPRVLGRRSTRWRQACSPSAGRVRLGRRGQHRVLGRPGRGASPRMFFTQLLPSSTYPIRSQLQQLVYQALVD